MLYRGSESTPRHRLFPLCRALCCPTPQTTALRWTTNGGPKLPDRPSATKPRFGVATRGDPSRYFPTPSCCCSSPGKPCILARFCAKRSFSRPSVSERLAEPDRPDTCAVWRHGNALRLKQPTRDAYTYDAFTTQEILSHTRQAHLYLVEQHGQMGRPWPG